MKIIYIIKKHTLLIFVIALVIITFAYFNLGLKDRLLYDPSLVGGINKFQDFTTLFLSIIIEAFPFVVLGTLVSVLVGLFVKEEWVLKYLPKNRVISHIVVSLLGVFMPVCECGNIPVARRLLSKGFNVSHSTTFLLAAPILNPLTLLTTLEAFNYDKSIAFIRIGSAFIVSVGIGLLISLKSNQKEFLNTQFVKDHCDVSHNHKVSLKNALSIFQSEFIEVVKLLCFGAFLAALSQSFIPRDIIVSLGQNPLFSVLTMIALAFVISICSNVDAFFALSYANTFTTGSILSFLVFGPMIDIKILSMLKTTFTTKYLIIISSLVFLSSVLIGLVVNYLNI